MSKFKKYTVRFLIGTIIIWVAYDIAALLYGGATVTISYVIWGYAKLIPFIAYALGVLCSHFTAPYLFKKINPIFRYLFWIIISCIVLFISIKFYPLDVIHPFVCLLFGLLIGFGWAQRKLKDKS